MFSLPWAFIFPPYNLANPDDFILSVQKFFMVISEHLNAFVARREQVNKEKLFQEIKIYCPSC